MPTATMTSKGQITVPVDVRRILGLHAGSRVAFVPTPDGTYELVPETGAIRELKGIISRPDKPVTLDEMEQGIIEGATESLG